MKHKSWLAMVITMGIFLLLGSLNYAQAQFLQIVGQPLEIHSNELGVMGIYEWEGGSLVEQYFGGDEGTRSSLFLNDSQIVFSNTTSNEFTPISHTRPDPWTIVTVFAAGETGIQITLTISYTNGASYYKKTWEIKNVGTTTYSNLMFVHGGDTYFANDDYSEGHWDNDVGMVYLTNAEMSVTGIMGFYGGLNSRPSAYYEGYFSDVWNAIAAGGLPNTVDSTYHDAGYALQWNRASLAPGETWTIEAFEKWTNAGYVQVIAPAEQAGNPGATVNYQFKINNYEAQDDTYDLTLESSSGWSVNLPDGNSISVPKGGSATVNAQVTIPSTALNDQTDVLKLTAVSHSDSTLANSDSVTTTVYAPIVTTPHTIVADVDGSGSIDVVDYHLISVPGVLAPDNDDALNVFEGTGGDRDISKIRLIWYDPQTSSYAEYPNVPTLCPDNAYWLITSIDRQVQVSGIPVPTNTPYTITLQPGWNIIGYPFLDRCNWSDVTVRTASGDYPIGDFSNVWVDHQAWGYLKGYTPIDTSTGVLEPWNGYWVRNLSSQNVDIVIPIPSSSSFSIPVNAKAPGRLSSSSNTQKRGFSFVLGQKDSNYRDSTLFLGLHPQALAGLDPMDSMAPPPISNQVPRIYVDHSGWKTAPGAYAVDIQQTGKYPATFNLVMEVPKSSKATTYFLEWKGALTLPAGLKAVMIDREKGQSINMKLKNSYTIVVPKNKTSYALKVVLQR